MSDVWVKGSFRHEYPTSNACFRRHDKLTDLQVIAAKQQQILEEHMRRTRIAEERLDEFQAEASEFRHYMRTQRKVFGAVWKTVAALIVAAIAKLLV